ncbi:MAG: hypothetical protein ABSD20_17105 [Terriglobales bacterium]|jgi:DNA-binding NtrC family response regulator
MPTVTILLAEQDLVAACSLAASLDSQFCSLRVFASVDVLRAAIPQSHADAVVADLETISLAEVSRLRRDFGLPVICTHRIPDDELWTAAIEAGANDVCVKTDVLALRRAITRTGPTARPLAA